MMIAINLKPGLKRKGGGNRLAGRGRALQGAGVQGQGPAARRRGCLVAGRCRLAGRRLEEADVGTRRDWQPRLEQARTENRRFKAFIQQKKKQELIRDSLLAQIGVIRDVDRDRYVWPHVLDEVAQALPAYTWLTEVVAQAAGGCRRCPIPRRATACASFRRRSASRAARWTSRPIRSSCGSSKRRRG